MAAALTPSIVLRLNDTSKDEARQPLTRQQRSRLCVVTRRLLTNCWRRSHTCRLLLCRQRHSLAQACSRRRMTVAMLITITGIHFTPVSEAGEGTILRSC
jgi:hypothetical protein